MSFAYRPVGLVSVMDSHKTTCLRPCGSGQHVLIFLSTILEGSSDSVTTDGYSWPYTLTYIPLTELV